MTIKDRRHEPQVTKTPVAPISEVTADLSEEEISKLLENLLQVELRWYEANKDKEGWIMEPPPPAPPLPNPGVDLPPTYLFLLDPPHYEDLKATFPSETFACYGGEGHHGQYALYVDDTGRLDGLTFNPVASLYSGRLVCGPAVLLIGEALRKDVEGE